MSTNIHSKNPVMAGMTYTGDSDPCHRATIIRVNRNCIASAINAAFIW